MVGVRIDVVLIFACRPQLMTSRIEITHVGSSHTVADYIIPTQTRFFMHVMYRNNSGLIRHSKGGETLAASNLDSYSIIGNDSISRLAILVS
jgi:hypothetical protein